jgi:spermidine/putrescine transport system ATP-binding protein
LVELRQVTKRFGGHMAVAGVDLLIESGEFLTLLGPSGCGKSTLLRMISGFESPSEGTVWLEGRDVTALPPYRRDVNQVFQSYALFPHLNVWENIAFGLRMKKVPRAERECRIGEAVELVSLGGVEQRRPHELSGGQKQRVALARALVCQPRVLLLDEPLAALDAKLRRSMQVELKRLQSRVGITFVFVTHDQEEALVMSDRIAVMNDGLIEQVGRAAEVYHKPATPFVADFLGQANILPAELLSTGPQLSEILVAGKQRLTVATQVLPESGQVGLVVIRPEKIRLASTPPEGPNVFEAHCREQIFRGATQQILLETPFSVLNVLCSGGAAAAAQKVFCSIDPCAVTVLTLRETPAG